MAQRRWSENEALAVRARGGDGDAMRALMERNVGLIVRGIRKAFPADPVEEHLGVAAEAFAALIGSYRPERGRVSTWIGGYLHHWIRRMVAQDRGRIYVPRTYRKTEDRFAVDRSRARRVASLDACASWGYEAPDRTPQRQTLDHRSIEALDPEHFGVLHCRLRGLTLEQTGLGHGLCKERIRQKQRDALLALGADGYLLTRRGVGRAKE